MRRSAIALDQKINQDTDLRGEMTAVGIESMHRVGFGFESLQNASCPARPQSLARNEAGDTGKPEPSLGSVETGFSTGIAKAATDCDVDRVAPCVSKAASDSAPGSSCR